MVYQVSYMARYGLGKGFVDVWSTVDALNEEEALRFARAQLEEVGFSLREDSGLVHYYRDGVKHDVG